MFIIILVYSFIVSNFVFFLYTVLVCFPGKLLSLCGFQIGSIHNVPIMSLKICLFTKIASLLTLFHTFLFLLTLSGLSILLLFSSNSGLLFINR